MTQASVRHFLDLADLSSVQLRTIVHAAAKRKQARHGLPKVALDKDAPLAGHMLAMMFQQPSTRTRNSFDLAMRQLGGQTMVMDSNTTQAARGESMGDTAAVLSRFADIIMLRTKTHPTLKDFVAQARVPVINGLTDFCHPCQVMSDILTFEEYKGPIKGKKIAWFGPSNNMTTSWIHAAVRFEFALHCAIPETDALRPQIVDWAQKHDGALVVHSDPAQAAKDAAALTTDCWVSMSDESKLSPLRKQKLLAYQVTPALMAAGDNAIFLHCMPAYRDEEVAVQVMEQFYDIVLTEAENRLHMQKAILLWCLDKL